MMYAGRELAMNRRAFLQSPAMFLAANGKADPAREWRSYAGDAAASRSSPCDAIKPSNVKNLKVAWVHKTQDANERPATVIECTPIVVDGVMYITTARARVQALNAATGELLWTFTPGSGATTSRRAAGYRRCDCECEESLQ